MEDDGLFLNNKVFFLPTPNTWLLTVLNSPLMWWHNWRYLPHMKDEALTPAGFLMESLPIARPSDEIRKVACITVQRLLEITAQTHSDHRTVLDRLRTHFAIEEPTQQL